MLLVLALAPLLTGFVRKVEGAPAAPARPAAAAALSRSRPALAQGGGGRRKRLLAVPRRSLSHLRGDLGRRRAGADLRHRPACSAGPPTSSRSSRCSAARASFWRSPAWTSGTSFGGIGSSREMMFATLAEPAMIMIVFTLALIAGSTQLSIVAGLHDVAGGRPARLARPRAGRAGDRRDRRKRAHSGRQSRRPIWSSTMVHEAMVLEYSGRHLAMIELSRAAQAAALRLADRLHFRSLGARPRRRGACAAC